MKTLKEWRIEAFPDGLSSEMNRGIELAWQACAAEYQPMLDELRKLAEEWNREVTGGEYSDLLRCSDQLLAVLDRSGARGGASRNEPERLVDNSSFTKDRSRTEWLRLQGRKI